MCDRDCKYHVVIVPKYRKRALYGKLKQDTEEILRDLARQKGIEILEGHLMPDHIHMCLKIPPKYIVAFALGFMKGKSAVRSHRKAGYKKVTGMHFWSRGYCVSTVGLDEETIKKYIRAPRGLSQRNCPLLGGYLRPPALLEEPHYYI